MELVKPHSGQDTRDHLPKVPSRVRQTIDGWNFLTGGVASLTNRETSERTDNAARHGGFNSHMFHRLASTSERTLNVDDVAHRDTAIQCVGCAVTR